jgi:hypothetical protein
MWHTQLDLRRQILMTTAGKNAEKISAGGQALDWKFSQNKTVC